MTVAAYLESIAFSSPFFINKSSIGERQSVGGACIFTAMNAASKFWIPSTFKPDGLRFSSISACSRIFFETSGDTFSNSFLRNDLTFLSLVFLASSATFQIACREDAAGSQQRDAAIFLWFLSNHPHR